ncbi:MAG: hypothetical protein ACE5EY_15360 [Anaerolineae bacterium]
MIVWLLAGWLAVARGRPSAGLVLAAVGALTKPIGLLALPFLALAGWRQCPDGRAKWRFVGLAGWGMAAAVWLAFLPFGSPLALGQRLLREAGNSAGFSAGALVMLFTGWQDWIGPAGLVLLGGAALWLRWRGGHGRSPFRGIADIFFVYVWQALNFRIWYAVWPFAWLLLDDSSSPRRHGDGTGLGYRQRVGMWFLLTSQLSVVIYGHVRAFWLGGSHLAAHLIGVPFTFLLPWVLGMVRYLLNIPGRVDKFS